VDLAGGWSDVPRFADTEGGVVVNAALRLAVHVEAISGGGGIRLIAEDLAERVSVRGAAELTYDGRLDLHKAAVNMLPVTGGIEVLTRADVPAGSGLGASGALDVALVAALARLRGETYDRAELAELGFHLEAVELGLEGGRQDQYAAAFGGVHEMVFRQGEVEVRPIALDPGGHEELERMLVVAYTGHSHFSAQTHRRVWDAYEAGRPDVVEALHALRDLGAAAATALRAGDWGRLAAAVDENWQQQQRLDATICTEGVRRVEEAARGAGSIAVKAAGAGAGGCLIVLTPPEVREAVAAAVTAVGARVLDARIDHDGVTVSTDDAPTPPA
jgi:D-glycero-alpha-D-manno-heptose-7-phosphate kinase